MTPGPVSSGSEPTFERWKELWSHLAARGDPAPAYRGLMAAWTEGHRAYHGLSHLTALLHDFDRWHHLADHPDEVEAAIWFHDVVYDPTRTDNEERSAVLAARVLAGAEVATEQVGRIVALIRATTHETPAQDPDAALLQDLDLLILAAPAEAFRAYERGVRHEYRHVGPVRYWLGRRRVLRKLAARPFIYQTAAIRETAERAARRNL